MIPNTGIHNLQAKRPKINNNSFKKLSSAVSANPSQKVSPRTFSLKETITLNQKQKPTIMSKLWFMSFKTCLLGKSSKSSVRKRHSANIYRSPRKAM